MKNEEWRRLVCNAVHWWTLPLLYTVIHPSYFVELYSFKWKCEKISTTHHRSITYTSLKCKKSAIHFTIVWFILNYSVRKSAIHFTIVWFILNYSVRKSAIHISKVGCRPTVLHFGILLFRNFSELKNRSSKLGTSRELL